MRTKLNFIKWLVFTAFIFSSKNTLVAQTTAFDSIINGSLSFYSNLDKSEMESNYLFNQGFIVLEDLEKWRIGVPIICKPWKWQYIYKAVNNSCINNCSLLPPYDSLLNDNIINHFGRSTVQLACINTKGDYISQENITNHATNDTPIDFENLQLFSGTILAQKSYSEEVTFEWDSKKYFSNLDGDEQIAVNFGDENGWKNLPLTGKTSYNVNYPCIGAKSISFRCILGQDTVFSFTSINVVQLQPIIPTEINTISVLIEDSTDYSQSRMSIPSSGNIEVSGQYFYFEGYDNKLDKPIIISEGFDVVGDQNWLDLHNSTHLNALRNNGYDVFYLTYTRSGRSLLENALIVKELIKFINNNKVDHFEGIYIGESMGGILGRIALKQLEIENYNHEFGLFIAIDSPMKGANIPLGLQWMVNDVFLSLGHAAIFLTLGTELFEFLANTDIPGTDILDQLTSPAAKQMIIRHYQGNSDYDFMQAYLDILGYPEKCRNVTATSGGENIEANVISEALENQYIIGPAYVLPLLVGLWQMNVSCKYSGVNVNNYQVSRVTYFNLFNPMAVGNIKRKVDFDYKKLDSSPGGLLNYEIGVYDIKFCFVPTSSSIGLTTVIFNSINGLRIFDRDNEVELINNGIIPFDDVYINRANKNHVDGFMRKEELDTMEIMYDRMYLQNRIINGIVNFEADYLIEIGRDLRTKFHEPCLLNVDNEPIINPNTGECEKNDFIGIDHSPDPFKNIDIGDFEARNGSNVTINSGEEIVLTPGTSFLQGSNVNLIISENPNLNRISSTGKEYFPEVKYSNCYIACKLPNASSKSSITWFLRNNKNEIINFGESATFKLDDWGQYEIKCSISENNNLFEKSFVLHVENDCRLETNKSTLTNYKSAIFIYPNPSNNYLQIELINTIELPISFEIISSDGRTILSENIQNNSIDISSLSNGLYFIKVKTPTTSFTEKFIKI